MGGIRRVRRIIFGFGYGMALEDSKPDLFVAVAL